MSKRFYGLCYGYTQEDIIEMIKELKRDGVTHLLDNYIVKEIHDGYVMEDKWEAEPPKKLHGGIDKIIIDAISIECINKKSRFKTFEDLTDYMVREEMQDMEEYLRHEEEWEY